MPKKRGNSTYLCGDMFAGAGGLTVGFHNAGFRSVFFNEIEEVFSETFNANFPEAHPFVQPIERLTARQVLSESGLARGELDVLIGGPPCQGFSINAPVRSSDDPRNHLFKHYLRLVLEGLRPKVIVMENVPGMLSLDKGKTLANIEKAFLTSGYQVRYKILNAAHYGVPQERWRLFFIASRLTGSAPRLPEPEHYSLRRPNFTGGKEHTFTTAIGEPNQRSLFSRDLYQPTSVKEAIDDLPRLESGEELGSVGYRRTAQNWFQKKMRKGSRKVTSHICSGLSPINFERLQYVKPGGSWRDIPFDLLPKGLKQARRSDHTRRYGRLDPSEPSGTIMTKCDPHWGTFFHYSQDRLISVREAARIQSFPDWFRFLGSKVDQYRQVGNAVPPLMAEAVASVVIDMLEGRSVGSLDREPAYATS